MNKKLMLLIVLLLCGLLMLTACGDSAEPTDGGDVIASETTDNPDNENTDNGEVITDSGNGEATYFFKLDETVKYDGLCEMSDLYAEVLDDDAVADGWYYYYTDTDQSPAKSTKWEPADDSYTTAEVLFTIKNISDKPQIFGDKIMAQLFYQENADADTDYFNGTVFQQNPGQVDESGEVIMWSTKPVEIAPGESTQVSFRFDIPKYVYDDMYAAAIGENDEILETCEFNFGDGTIYIINLADVLIAASRCEG